MLTDELKENWAKALESGNYQQGKGFLQNNNCFCCLGVLCDISKLGKWVMRGNTWFYDIGNFTSATSVSGSDLLRYEEQEILIGLNDTKNKTFAEIAQHIRENL